MIIILRGGGDLASGVAIRLHRAGFRVVITEIPMPLAVRRLVAFSEAVYNGRTQVEEVTAVHANGLDEIKSAFSARYLPVVVDPAAEIRHSLPPGVLIDGRMAKSTPDLGIEAAPLVIGLGPGFIAGENCHAVVETRRGHTLGRVIWEGSAAVDTGLPEPIGVVGSERVVRAPAAGNLRAVVSIGDKVEAGRMIASVAGVEIAASFPGVVRGLLPDGFPVEKGMKIGDIDPRADAAACRLVSDKALAVGGGVLEAVLSRIHVRFEPGAE